MIRALLAKELRQHWMAFAGMGLLQAVALLAVLGMMMRGGLTVSAFDPLRFVIGFFGAAGAMMLGHRPYALERLTLAASVPDAGLQELSSQLQPYFDAPVSQAQSAEPLPAVQGDGGPVPSGSPHACTQTLLRPWPLAS